MDVFSKYGWLVPVPSKTNQSMIKAFSNIFSKSARKPFKLNVDMGKEFHGKEFKQFLKKKGIDIFSTKNMDTKATLVERFNRTIMTRLSRYFTHKGTTNFKDVLPKIIQSYNNTKHSATGFAPIDVNNSNSELVWRRLYEESPRARHLIQRSDKTESIPVGTPVRVSKAKEIFKKGYAQGWTDEIFTVNQVLRTRPTTYVISDFNNEVLEGSFYHEEIQPVEPDVYRIEKVLKERGRGKTKQVYVKWKGYPDSANSWVAQHMVISLQK